MLTKFASLIAFERFERFVLKKLVTTQVATEKTKTKINPLKSLGASPWSLGFGWVL